MVMLFDRMKSQSVLEIPQCWLKRVKRVGREYDRIFSPIFIGCGRMRQNLLASSERPIDILSQDW